MNIQKIEVYYIIGINILSFIVMSSDKYKAKKKKYRISEGFLIALALIGGSIGTLISIYILNHKTRKLKFRYGVPIIITIQAIFLYSLKYIWL